MPPGNMQQRRERTRTRWLLLVPLLVLPGWAGAAGLEALRNAAEQSPQALARLRNLAERGNARAELYLGTLYAPPIVKKERTVGKDAATALAWYHRAAQGGCARADFDLGLAYEEGMGVPRSPAMARHYFGRMAALARQEAVAGSSGARGGGFPYKRYWPPPN
ncbi:tetratricopeptide repeat protein [Acidithiobacillus sulfuriphilus]|uniref:tetratricopeptide repeat protein n=1 Tax=Acidithiobacillus sulfuriphilus TaxID=1867749 RepID=UPI003F609FAC